MLKQFRPAANITNKKVSKAQYDKSYNAVILGVNWDFTEDVTEKEQTELKNKYSIPEVPDKDNFYTFETIKIHSYKYWEW